MISNAVMWVLMISYCPNDKVNETYYHTQEFYTLEACQAAQMLTVRLNNSNVIPNTTCINMRTGEMR